MSDIVEFLRARLDEDERVARAALDGPYGVDGWWFIDPNDPHEDVLRREPPHPVETPERVLREVEAKRDIVNEAAYYLDFGGEEVRVHATHSLESLVSVYAGHPDYRTEWP